MNIVIAYDGSEYAEAALNDLTRAGLPSEASAHVVSAADVWFPPDPQDSAEGAAKEVPEVVRRARKQAMESLDRARAIAHQGAERVRQSMPGWEVTIDVCADSPAWAVIKVIESWPADLAILGSHGMTRLERLLLGSVSQKVLAEAQCSVRIGRKGNRTADEPVRILVGLDGSKDSRSTVDAVSSRHWPADSEARLVTAIDASIETDAAYPHESLRGWIRKDDEDVSSWITRMMIEEGNRLDAAGLRVSTKVRFAVPRDAIVEEAAKWGADTIFVGARGHRMLDRLLLGSVSSAIAARAACSVEVVRVGNQS